MNEALSNDPVNFEFQHVGDTPKYDNGAQMAYPGEGPNSQGYGLTKRELFAAMMLQGILPTMPDLKAKPGSGPITERHLAEQAVVFADALLTALDVTK